MQHVEFYRNISQCIYLTVNRISMLTSNQNKPYLFLHDLLLEGFYIILYILYYVMMRYFCISTILCFCKVTPLLKVPIVKIVVAVMQNMSGIHILESFGVYTHL